jgi:hypothetical protein
MNLSEFKRSTASGDIEMTDTLLSPDDTGEIPQPVGETRIRIETGEKTRNLREERDAILAATGRLRHFDAPPQSLVTGHGYDPEAHSGPIVDLFDTVTFRITDDLAGPQSPPPPLPPVPPAPPQYDMDTERLSLLGTVAGLDGDLYSAPPTLRRSVPYVIPADARRWSRPRHAKPAPLWARAALLVGGAMVAVAVAALAVLAVVR